MAPEEPARSGRLEIRLATEAELSEVLGLLTEAAQWSRDHGVEGLWRVPYPPEWVRPSLGRSEVYLAVWNGVAAGTLTFRWDDRPTWGERPPDAGYVHKLAVRRTLKGLGLGARMLDWSGTRAALRGRAWLRLDCLASHRTLRSHYESLGFRPAGEATVEGNAVTLLQRPARLGTEGRTTPARHPPNGQY
jgi:GNAT superfamily N-acetyltransferase